MLTSRPRTRPNIPPITPTPPPLPCRERVSSIGKGPSSLGTKTSTPRHVYRHRGYIGPWETKHPFHCTARASSATNDVSANSSHADVAIATSKTEANASYNVSSKARRKAELLSFFGHGRYGSPQDTLFLPAVLHRHALSFGQGPKHSGITHDHRIFFLLSMRSD